MGQSQSKRTSGGSSRAGHEGRYDSSFTGSVRRGLKRVRSFFDRSSQTGGSETSSVAPLQSSKRIRTEEGGIEGQGEVTMAAGGVQQRSPDVERDAPWNRFKRSLDGLASLSVRDDVGARGDDEIAAEEEKEYLQFPFLTDERSRKWVSENPVLFVMRGLSGSGKSTVVRAIVRTFPWAAVCSADQFFVDKVTGEYRWFADGLKSAHEECQKSAEEALEKGEVVIIDNTNVRRWEMGFYFKAAVRHGYHVVVLESKTPWKSDPAALADKNSHGVTEDVLRQKVGQFEVVYPMYFAWFVSLVDSQALLKMTRDLLKKCLENCDMFRTDFEEFSGLSDMEAMLRYFNRHNCLDSNKKTVHCTAKFCGDDKDSAKKYCSRKEVVESLGKTFDLKIIGFVITKGTFGARIMLDEEELELYAQNEDNVDEERRKFEGRSGSGFKRNKVQSGKKPSYKERLRMAEETAEMEKLSLDASSLVSSDMAVIGNRYYPIPGRGKRAHVTLGTSGDTKPVVTGLDVVRAVEAEKAASEKEADDVPTFEMGNGLVLRRYEKDLWVLYPRKAVTFDAMFTGHYS